MNWPIFLMTWTIPLLGVHHIYRAYRLWFKADYSGLKNNNGEIPDNPETLGALIAKLHLGTGLLVLVVCVFAIHKVPLKMLILLVTPVFIVYRIGMNTLVWRRN